MLRTVRGGCLLLALATASCTATNDLDSLKGAPTTILDGGPAPCTGQRADCDGNSANGCEVDLNAHPLNCGVCGRACPSAPSADPACDNGQCGIQCDAFTDDCDGDMKNGCESPVEKDVNNCGACGNVCGTTNADSSACAAGKCEIECSSGFANCDGNDASGCEVDLSAPANSGSCTRNCGDGPCTAGACEPVLLAENLRAITALGVVGDKVWLGQQYLKCSTCGFTREVASVPVSGGTPTVVVSAADEIRGFASNCSKDLYYLYKKRLWVLKLGASTPVELHAGSDNGHNPRWRKVHSVVRALRLRDQSGLCRQQGRHRVCQQPLFLHRQLELLRTADLPKNGIRV